VTDWRTAPVPNTLNAPPWLVTIPLVDPNAAQDPLESDVTFRWIPLKDAVDTPVAAAPYPLGLVPDDRFKCVISWKDAAAQMNWVSHHLAPIGPGKDYADCNSFVYTPSDTPNNTQGVQANTKTSTRRAVMMIRVDGIQISPEFKNDNCDPARTCSSWNNSHEVYVVAELDPIKSTNDTAFMTVLGYWDPNWFSFEGTLADNPVLCGLQQWSLVSERPSYWPVLRADLNPPIDWGGTLSDYLGQGKKSSPVVNP
jgi:hypothetical protein